jgi:hypothetical protein
MPQREEHEILRGEFIEGSIEARNRMHRREMMKAMAAGALGLAAGNLMGPGRARADSTIAQFPGMGDAADGMTYDNGPSALIHKLGEPGRFNQKGALAYNQQLRVAQGPYAAPPPDNGIDPQDLGTITNVLWGTGLYIGNEYYNWSDSTKAAVHAQVAAWGFDFVSPKVGGYGSTWYGTDDQLRYWRDTAWNVGIGYAPFIYSVPNSYTRDAQICSEITNAVGVAIADMEDEWAYAYSAMTAWGNVYRFYNPYDAVIVTGYGDPITRFGRGVFPGSQLAAWCDGYSPQWYYGVWTIYHNYGVIAAIDWADAECGDTFGWSYPLCPSMSIYSSWNGGILPLHDMSVGEQYSWNWQAPIIWWEYGGMNDTRALACLGYY